MNRLIWALFAFVCLAVPDLPAQTVAASRDKPRTDQTDLLILGSLAKNPVTAPYRFQVQRSDAGWVVSGRVGTKAIYDEAIRTVLGITNQVVDRLVIDTASVSESAASGSTSPISIGSVWPWGLSASAAEFSIVYPPPLFQGWWVDPFWGMEPPIIAYPPYWAALSAARQAEAPGANVEAANAAPGPPASVPEPPAPRPPAPRAQRPAANEGAQPAIAPDLRTDAVTPVSIDPLVRDARAAIARAAGLKDAAIHVEAAGDGGILISGDVAGVVEAMHAFLAAKRTPGVRRVDDRLRFPVPSVRDGENPLRSSDEVSDVAEYLSAQIERNFGAGTHISGVRIERDEIFMEVDVATPEAKRRAEAIVRSMPLLRGFRPRIEWRTVRP